MSLSKSNTSDLGTIPIDLSKAALPTSDSHVTMPAISVSQNSIMSHATIANFQGHPTYGIRVANSTVSVPGALSQALTSQISSTVGGSLQVSRSGIPLVSAGIGPSQVVYPRIAHPAFSHTIPISSAIIGQQITLQHLPGKGPHLPLGSVTQISGQQVIQHGSANQQIIQHGSTNQQIIQHGPAGQQVIQHGSASQQIIQHGSSNQRVIQHGPTSPGKAISPRSVVSGLQRPVISNYTTSQHFQKSNAPTLVSVSQAQQIGLRVPNAAGQQMTIQRAVSPLVAQQISGTNQPSFIQCLSNAAVVTQQIAQSSPNPGSLQTSQSIGGNLRATSPIGTATIVGPTSHIGTATFVAGQPISIQPRPPVAYIASAPPTGMTLTVTSISPGPTSLQTSSSTSTQPTQQVLWPGSPISQGQVIRTGIPVVLPRGTLAFTGRPQLIQSSAVPRLIQKPLVSLSANCGGQVTVQVPQVISPVIKTVLQNQPTILSSKDNDVVQAVNSSQSPAGVIFTAVLVSTAGVTPSNQPPLTTFSTTSPTGQVARVDSINGYPPASFRESSTVVSEPVTGLPSLTSITTVTTTTASCAVPATVSSSGLPVAATTLSSTQLADKQHGERTPIRDNPSSLVASDADNITTITATSISTSATQIQNQPTISEPSHEKQDISCVTESPPDAASNVKLPDNGCGLEEVCPASKQAVTDVAAHSQTFSAAPSSPSMTSTTQSAAVPAQGDSISVLSLSGPEEGSIKESEDHQLSLPVEPASHDGDANDGVVLTEGLIDSNLLEWSDGVGKLPGTDMKFKINEFGDLELIEDGGSNVDGRSNKLGESKQDNNVTDIVKEGISRVKDKDCSVSDPSELSEHEGDQICCCVYCGRYGYKSNFKTSGRFCSQNCAGKRKLHRKQVIMSRMMMGMKKKKKKLILSGEVKSRAQEQQNGSSSPVSEKKLLNFDWDSYLAETKAVAAPKRLFKEPFPTSRNGFRLGMRLEGADPKHQSLFCVLSVAEVQGYRLRLHFDGYSECYDFWVNADSPFIFPVGWSEKNGKTLQPPKNIPMGEFNWTTYLKQTRAVAAPKHLFLNQPSSVVPSAFRVGMKLEAVDKKNSSLVCVATVADTLGDRILIHFDGWEDAYDYWCDVTSPSIRPVGWCQDNGHTLSPPPDYEDGGNFTWENYLQRTHSTAVPARGFKTRGPMGFEKGMKVEVTDKRNPILIRAATIADVQDYRLLIHFDGWDSIYDYWIDDDSGDLHPPNWCSKTFHPLQSPIDKKSLKHAPDSGGCPTIGCNGIGHIKGAKYTGHHSAFGCPYSEVNMSKDSALTDRLGSSRSEEGSGQPVRYDGTADMRKCPTQGCDGLGHVTGKFTSHHCLSGCPLAEKNLAKIKQENVQEPRPVGRPGRGRKRKLFSLSQPTTDKVIKTEVMEEASEDRSTFHASIHESVFQSMAPSPAMMDQPLCWEQHAKLLPGVAEVSQTLVSSWTVDEVAAFVLKLTGNEEQAQKFKEEQVDGDSFLLLQQSDLMNFLNIKLGPAIKIFNSILVFKAASESY